MWAAETIASRPDASGRQMHGQPSDSSSTTTSRTRLVGYWSSSEIHSPTRPMSITGRCSHRTAWRPTGSLASMTSFAAGLLASGGSGSFVDVDVQWWHWAILLTLIVSLLLFDLLVLHRTPKVLSTKRAAIESTAWIAIGLGFTLAIW